MYKLAICYVSGQKSITQRGMRGQKNSQTCKKEKLSQSKKILSIFDNDKKIGRVFFFK